MDYMAIIRVIEKPLEIHTQEGVLPVEHLTQLMCKMMNLITANNTKAGIFCKEFDLNLRLRMDV